MESFRNRSDTHDVIVKAMLQSILCNIVMNHDFKVCDKGKIKAACIAT